MMDSVYVFHFHDRETASAVHAFAEECFWFNSTKQRSFPPVMKLDGTGNVLRLDMQEDCSECKFSWFNDFAV
jgi:hypothetical protein